MTRDMRKVRWYITNDYDANVLQIQYSPLLSWHRFRFCWRTKTHISENENAYFRERRRIFQRTKTQKKKTKTHKNEEAKKRVSIGALYKSLQIINRSFI